MTGVRAGLKALIETERCVNLHPYPKINGWQVNQATEAPRDFGERGFCPAWHFWAGHWDLNEPAVVAETLAALEVAVLVRQRVMYYRLPLALRNRRILAAQQQWPEGVVEECERLEELNPRWSVSWRPEGLWLGQLDVPMHACELSADDPDELNGLMDEVPEHDYSVHGCAWCRGRLAEAAR
jgi:hypothetical protein